MAERDLLRLSHLCVLAVGILPAITALRNMQRIRANGAPLRFKRAMLLLTTTLVFLTTGGVILWGGLLCARAETSLLPGYWMLVVNVGLVASLFLLTSVGRSIE